MWSQRGLVRGTSPHPTAHASFLSAFVIRWQNLEVVFSFHCEEESTGVNLEKLMFSPPIVEFALEIPVWIHLCLMYISVFMRLYAHISCTYVSVCHMCVICWKEVIA